jgi:deoxynucleoside kinase
MNVLPASSRPKIICLEGNIGAGKSTILNVIEQECKRQGRTDIVILKEPIEEWEKTVDKDDGESILEKYYSNQKKYAFSFQVFVFTTIVETIKKTIASNPECKYILCERSLHSSRDVFAKMLYFEGIFEDIQYTIYNRMCDSAIGSYVAKKVIYLNVNPHICYRRVAWRGRIGEEKIPLSYLEKCGKFHELWINTLLKKGMIPVLQIDGNENFEEHCESKSEREKIYQQNVATQIIDFIYAENSHSTYLSV